MRLNDRHLGYLVIAVVFAVLLLIWAVQRDNYRPPPAPPAQEIKATSPPKPAPAAVPKVPPDLCRQAAFFIAKMKGDGLVDYWISPEGLDSLVFVEPRVWQSFIHQEKITFVQMFIDFFICRNQKYPASKPVSIFAVLNLTTRERLARGWLIRGGEGYPPGTVEIFK